MLKPNELWEVSTELAAVARGDRDADMVIKNGRLINVATRELLTDQDIAIKEGRIALVGDVEHTIGDNTRVLNADGKYICPGFMDGHIHVESSMVTLNEYSRTVLPHGTTAIFMDPHEIANVLGIKGIKMMIEKGKNVPLRVFTTIPSCVPAAPGYEDSGAIITAEEVEEVMQLEGVIGLGEMMNFPGVIKGNREVHDILAATMKAGKIITGHYSLSETGEGLNGYIASGIRCCHESVRKEDALAKMRRSMYAQLREGSAWRDVKETVKSITEHNVDTRFTNLISDDTHPHTLLENGHLDHIVKRAIEEGVNPLTAIQMVTINVAQCFSCDRDFGSIAPGKVADILLLSDLSRVEVDEVIVGGKLMARDKNMLVEPEESDFPTWALNSIHLNSKITKEDLEIKTDKKNKSRVRVIEVIENKTGTFQLQEDLPVKEGKIQVDIDRDIAKVAIFERHNETGSMSRGFVKGLGIKKGAVASTVAHDTHNLLVVGVNDEDMVVAANKLAEVGGGMVAVFDGKVLALLELPVAGLMSTESIENVKYSLDSLAGAWERLGSTLESPFMTMALLALPVLPEIRITNRGLVDSVNFNFLNLEV